MNQNFVCFPKDQPSTLLLCFFSRDLDWRWNFILQLNSMETLLAGCKDRGPLQNTPFNGLLKLVGFKRKDKRLYSTVITQSLEVHSPYTSEAQPSIILFFNQEISGCSREFLHIHLLVHQFLKPANSSKSNNGSFSIDVAVWKLGDNAY